MNNRILFLTLKVFSSTGGIEKVCRIVGKALNELTVDTKGELKVYSMYDNQTDDKYFPSQLFAGWAGNKKTFVFQSVMEGMKSNIVILSHINLLIVGYLIKLFSPKTKLILIAHGIEVWSPLSFWKKRMLTRCDRILTVSNYTKDKMREMHLFPEDKFRVFNNCLDPFLPEPKDSKSGKLLDKYNFTKEDIIILTLTRLSAKEKYKGYDTVLKSLQKLKKKSSKLKYLMVGKYDAEEKERLDKLLIELNLDATVKFAGFVGDDELADHFQLADLYVMPSEKEGFGIVFIEAMFYGLPVIAGNKDGSVDALLNGKLGQLVDPQNLDEIINAIENILSDRVTYIPDNNTLLEKFSYDVYKNNLHNILKELKN